MLLYGKLPHHILADRVSDQTDVIKYTLDRYIFKQMVQSKTCGHAESHVENVWQILD